MSSFISTVSAERSSSGREAEQCGHVAVLPDQRPIRLLVQIDLENGGVHGHQRERPQHGVAHVQGQERARREHDIDGKGHREQQPAEQ